MTGRTKSLTVAGKRYRLSTRSYDAHVELRGPGIRPWITLPAGVTLDSPDLRVQVLQAIERDRKCRKNASECVQQRVREGKAGLTQMTGRRQDSAEQRVKDGNCPFCGWEARLDPITNEHDGTTCERLSVCQNPDCRWVCRLNFVYADCVPIRRAEPVETREPEGLVDVLLGEGDAA